MKKLKLPIEYRSYFTCTRCRIEFAVATGRTVSSGYSLIKERGIACPFIELNGARYFDENEQLHYTKDMNKEDVQN